MTSVVTLTPAPVLDRTYIIDTLTPGKVNRAIEAYQYLSGKGLNVARNLHLAKTRVSGILPIGREDEYLLFSMPQPHIIRFMPITGRIRVNTTVVEKESGRTTNFNQFAIPIGTQDWKLVCDLTAAEVDAMDADWLVVSGMQPVNPDTNEYVDMEELFQKARKRGARIAIDTSGPTLVTWARSPLVNLIKPNCDELASLVGYDLNTIGDVVRAGKDLIAEGNLEIILASIGADGAIIITKESAHWAYTDPVDVVNTTGAGDATLAGFIKGVGPHDGVLDLEAGLKLAVSWGGLAVTLPTTLIEDFANAPSAFLGDLEANMHQPLQEPSAPKELF